MGRLVDSYDSFVFDFYGTLVDIWTDEEDERLWRTMAGIYACYGADYSAAEFKAAYKKAVAAAEAALKEKTGAELPEIELGSIFIELLMDAPKAHPALIGAAGRIEDGAGSFSYETRNAAERIGGAEHWSEMQKSAFAAGIANTFRVVSRKRFGAYKNTVSTLSALKKAGKKLYLLSNAQGVFTVPEIEQAGVYGLLDDMFISSEQGMKKPEAAFLLKLMEKHRLDPSRTAMVGNDVAADMGIAALCGTGGILLNTDGLTDEETARRIKKMQAATRTQFTPVVVKSGDIAEILQM